MSATRPRRADISRISFASYAASAKSKRLTMRSALLCASGIAAWLSCRLAEARMKLTWMSPSMTSRWAL